jgi:AraC-like DNA-binding protein
MVEGLYQESIVKIEEDLFSILLDCNFYGESIVTPMHNHPVFEVHFIQSGDYRVETDRVKKILKNNTCCVIKPNTYHCVYTSEDSGIKHNFRFSCTAPNPQLDRILRSSKWKDDLIIYEGVEDEIRLVRLTIAELEEKPYGYLTSVHNLLSLLLLTVIRKITDIKKPDFGNFEEKNKSSRNSALIDRYIYFNYTKNIGLPDIARYLKISERQVNRIFIQLYGLTFKKKIAQMRIVTAKNMLLQYPNISITEITQTVGYNDPYYFNAVFKKSVGMTPAQFRKNAFGNEEKERIFPLPRHCHRITDKDRE